MKKILLLPTNLDLNRGDQALVWEAVRFINDVYHNEEVNIKIMATDIGEDAEIQIKQSLARGYSFLPQLLNHPGRNAKKKNEDRESYTLSTYFTWGCQALYDYCHTRLLLSESKYIRGIGKLFLNSKEKNIIKEFEQADAIYFKGGGWLHSFGSITDIYLSYYFLFHFRLAEALRKKVYVLPNSIGPLVNSIYQKMVVNTLKRCTLVTVRERISLSVLENFNVRAFYYPDFGFYLKPSEKDFKPYLMSHGVDFDKEKVVVTLRPNRFSGEKDGHQLYLNYVLGAVRLVEYLVKNNYHVTFFAHTLGPSSHEDDRNAIQDVHNCLSTEILRNTTTIEDFSLTCEDVEKIYSYYDYMMGTRFHSVIFSLNVGVPAGVIAYGGNKGKGIMEVLNNGDYTVDMNKVTEESLVELFIKLREGKSLYLMHLSNAREVLEKKRCELLREVRLLESVKIVDSKVEG